MARYGREQRGRAVDLYVRYERCAADVIRELGHPGKGALLSWYADRLEEERTRGGDAQEEAPDGRGEESRRGDYGVGKHADVCFVKFLWAVSAFLLVRLSGCF